MGQSILITSGKGGSGTTTFTVNLGTVLANSGAKVLILDMNIGLRNDDIYLGVENNILFDLGDIISGVCTIQKAVVATDVDGLYLLSPTQCKEITGLSQSIIMNLLLDLKDDYDYILIDCPVSLGKLTEYIASDCEKALLIVTPDYVSVRNTDAISRRLSTTGFIKQYFAINRVSNTNITNELSLDLITKSMSIPFIGIIAEDQSVNYYNNQGLPIVNQSVGSSIVKAFIEITARIVA